MSLFTGRPSNAHKKVNNGILNGDERAQMEKGGIKNFCLVWFVLKGKRERGMRYGRRRKNGKGRGGGEGQRQRKTERRERQRTEDKAMR